jgi:hypothetical protein
VKSILISKTMWQPISWNSIISFALPDWMSSGVLSSRACYFYLRHLLVQRSLPVISPCLPIYLGQGHERQVSVNGQCDVILLAMWLSGCHPENKLRPSLWGGELVEQEWHCCQDCKEA